MIKTELDSMPAELDELSRKIMRDGDRGSGS